MLKDNWDEKNGTYVGNMILQRFPNNDHLAEPSSRRNVSALTFSGSTTNFVEPMTFRNQQFHQQSHPSQTPPIFNANPHGNGAEKSLLPVKSCSKDEGKSLTDPNLQELIKFLSVNHGLHLKTPLEIGTPEYLRLVEILKQSSTPHNNGEDEEILGGSEHNGINSKVKGTKNTQNNHDSIENEASICRDKNDLIFVQPKKEVEKLTSEKSTRVATEKLWEGCIQLSSSVTLTAVASFKSGEKLVGNSWPEFIEVKGKVRLEAFEKYVQDLPRSRNRGLMVISLCWKEGSSDIGLTGMKEVAKGYKKSCRVGFAHLLSGIDLYLCPRSDPIITILAKYGFFKGMAVLDDKPDSMIGCVVWRKNRPQNPSENKNSPPNSPPGFSIKKSPEKKLSPEKLSNQNDQPLTLPLTTSSENSKNIIEDSEVDHKGGNSTPLWNPDSCKLVEKRAFVDDDLPEFDFGIASGKSTLVSSIVSGNKRLAEVNCQKLGMIQAVEKNNGILEQKSSKKSKLFDNDDMPEWCPPQLHHQIPTTSNFQTLPPRLPPPPRPPILPPPQADTHPSFSYQQFRPAISSLPTSFIGAPSPPPPPPPRPPQQPLASSFSGRFNPNQGLWHHPGSLNVNLPSRPSNRRHP